VHPINTNQRNVSTTKTEPVLVALFAAQGRTANGRADNIKTQFVSLALLVIPLDFFTLCTLAIAHTTFIARCVALARLISTK